MNRCSWCQGDPLYEAYHDEEWGLPLHDDQKLFEFLLLESAQAGLSWITILRKREGYRKAFDGFDPMIISQYGSDKVDSLLLDSSIIRNRRKIESAINNAKAFLKVQEEYGSFDHYIWSFVDGQPIDHHFTEDSEIPARTPLSETISKDLKKKGFSFLGPVSVYAFMQAIGMVNDHLVSCFRYSEVGGGK